MAALAFTVQADYNKVIRLRDEIKRLEAELTKLGKNSSPQKVKELENRLAECKKEMGALVEKAAIAGAQMESEADKINRAFRSVSKSIAGVFTAAKIKDFVVQVGAVRGEFQKLNASLTTLLDSEEKATALMQQLTRTAATTPFNMEEVATGAKQLLAYGVEANKVNDTLVKLGDIAAGVNAPLGDLVYLYGTTMTQGRVYTQDMRQFMGRGIPLAEELAKQFGVTADKVSELVTAGKVGAQEFEKALLGLAETGGRYAGLMDAQSKTIAGQYSNLEDAVQTMFNKIGQSSEGAFSLALQGASELVTNYEQVGKVLGGLAATYGTYKAVVMVTAAVEQIRYQATLAGMAGMTKMQAVTDVLKAKTELLNKAILKNPYALIAASIVALVAGVWAFSRSTDAATKAQKKLNDVKTEAVEKMQEEKQKIDALISVAKDEAKTINDRQTAIKELNRIIPDYNAQLDATTGKYIENKQALDNYLTSLQKQYEVEGAKDLLKDLGGKKAKAKLKQAKAQQELDKEQKRQNEIRAKAKADGRTFAPQEGQAYYNIMEMRKGVLKQANDALRDIEAQEKEINKVFGEDIKNAVLKTVTTSITPPTTNKKAETEAERLKKEAIARAKAQADYVQAVKRQNAQAALEIEQADIDNLDEGFDKRTRQINLNYKKLEAENKKREEDMLNALADNMLSQYIDNNPKSTEEQRAAYRTSLTDENNPDRLTRKDLTPDQINQLEEYARVAKKTQEKSYKDLYKELFEQYKNYAARRKEVEEKFAKDVEQIKKSNRTEGEKGEAIAEAERQRKESIERINNEEVEATKETSSLMIELFKDTSEQSTKQLDSVVAKTKELLQYIKNTKPSDMTADKALSFGFTLDELKALSGAPEKIKAITEQVEKLENVANKSNPFRQLAQSLQDLFSKSGKDKSADVETKLKKLGKSAAETADYIGDIAGKLSGIFEEIGNIEMADAFGAIELVMGAVSNIGKGFAEGGIAGGIAAVAGEAINLVSSAIQANARHVAALKEVMQEMTAQQNAYTLAILESKLAAEDIVTIFGGNAWGKALRAVEVAKESVQNFKNAIRGTSDDIRKLYENQEQYLIDSNGGGIIGAAKAASQIKNLHLDESNAGLRSIQVKTGHKKTGFLGLGKGKDLYSSILDIYPDLIDAEGKLNKKRAEAILQSQTLKDDGKERLQQILDFAEEEEKAVEQLKTYFSDIFGELSNDMSNALVEAFKNGTDAAQAFTKSVTSMLEELGEQMIYNVTLAPIMEEAQKQMLEITQNSGLSDEEKFRKYTQVLSTLTDDAITQQEHFAALLEQYKQMASEKGYNLWSNTSQQEASRGYSQEMSEDTGKEVSGRLTAVAESGDRRNETLLSISTKLDGLATTNMGIRDIASDTRDIIAQSYLELQEIKENTGVSAKGVKQVVTVLQDIKSSGLRVK